MDYWAKDICIWGIFSAEVYPRSSLAANGSDVVNFLVTQWSTDGSTSSEPMGLCVTSIVKTLTDNHTLDDRNHQGHHTTLLLPETMLFTTQGMTRSGLWQSTPSDVSRCLASSGQHLVDGEGSSGSSSGFSRMVPPPHLKRIIGVATAAFPWPTDQPQVWPAVVAAFTGLEPPRLS